MEFFEHIFKGIPNDALVEVAYGAPPFTRSYITVEALLALDIPQDRDMYFSPAPRREKGSEKKDVYGSRVVWVDYDDDKYIEPTLPPSFHVESGHGHHLYWLLDEWSDDVALIEEANKAMVEDTGAKDVGPGNEWNVNRLLRVPGSRNHKEEPPMDCTLRSGHRDRSYQLAWFPPMATLDRKTRHKIRTGDRRGYRSRSERDWAVVRDLVKSEAPDDLITHLFTVRQIGDKYDELGPTSGDKYLHRTITKARESKGGGTGPRTIEEREDGYYTQRGKSVRRLSTFTIRPGLLLENIDEQGDAIVGDVVAGSYSWKDITFTRTAFQSVAKLDRECPLAAWQWLGNDSDVRLLLPYLLKTLEEEGLPRVAATGVLGLHKLRDSYLFVGDRATLGKGEVWPGSNGPLVYLDPRREHAKLAFGENKPPSSELLDTIRSVVPRVNQPWVVWPTLGWYAATPLKPFLEDRGYRFPILNVHGTKGSGKTTLIQRVMMPLFGQKEPKSYDANTTRFVVLSLLGSSNAVPVAFSEFRFGSADKFLRYVLLSYDQGHDPRGRADQTTVDYPLSAPFSVDGEDAISDPAAKERVVAVTLRPATVLSDEDANDAYKELQFTDLTPFGEYYVQRLLRGIMDGTVETELRQARRDLDKQFPQRLPDRVRNNYIVARLGVRLFCRVGGLDLPDAGTFTQSLRTVFDFERGRAPTYADEMVEDIVNAVAIPGRRAYFRYHYERGERVLWFQLSPAHSWWIYQRRRQARGALEQDALQNQLIEAPFMKGKKIIDGTLMWGVDLVKAQGLGLDIPDDLDIMSIQL